VFLKLSPLTSNAPGWDLAEKPDDETGGISFKQRLFKVGFWIKDTNKEVFEQHDNI